MNDMRDEIATVVREVCTKLAGEESPGIAVGGWNAPLWASLEDLGMTTIGVPEENGGSGGTLGDITIVLEVLGECAAMVPFAESCVLGGWLLALCGEPVQPGPTTVALAADGLEIVQGPRGVLVRGSIPGVPWARYAERLLVVHASGAVLLKAAEFEVRPGLNLAGEPRDEVLVDQVLSADRDLGRRFNEQPHVVVEQLHLRAGLARAAQLAGAAGRALELSIRYAGEREQFGRPIGRFQAVQQHLAAMAGEVLAMKLAVQAAAIALEEGAGGLAVAAAKTTASSSAGTVASLAHQIHGAIGYTAEHPLHHATTRLWAWRDECGSEQTWAATLGRQVLDAGDGGLWPVLTGSREAR